MTDSKQTVLVPFFELEHTAALGTDFTTYPTQLEEKVPGLAAGLVQAQKALALTGTAEQLDAARVLLGTK